MGKILSKERKKALDKFREKAIHTVKEMIKEEKNPVLKKAFTQTLKNIASLPLEFYPRKYLSARFARSGKMVIGSIIKGQQVSKIIVYEKGLDKRVIIQSKIQLPAEYIFEGNKLSLNGIHTLMHEYCHFPRDVRSFAQGLNISEEQAEELIADLVSARISVKMGMEKEKVYSFYSGRDAVFYPFPFRRVLEKVLFGK